MSGAAWPEVDAVIEVLDRCAPTQATECRGWTCHTLLAHLTAGAEEMIGALRAAIDATTPPMPRFGDDREQPYRDMDDSPLRDRFHESATALVELLGEVRASNVDVVHFAGLPLSPDYLENHARTELAIHRWDLAGDDDTSATLLGQRELLEHAVVNLGQLLLLRGLSNNRPDPGWRARLRSPGQPDVEIAIQSEGQTISLVDRNDDAPALLSDPAARLLLLWGRTPRPVDRIRSSLAPADYASLAGCLAGY